MVCVHAECPHYLQLYEVHKGDPQYLLPGEEFTYECVDMCASDNAVEQHGQQYCKGESA